MRVCQNDASFFYHILFSNLLKYHTLTILSRDFSSFSEQVCNFVKITTDGESFFYILTSIKSLF